MIKKTLAITLYLALIAPVFAIGAHGGHSHGGRVGVYHSHSSRLSVKPYSAGTNTRPRTQSHASGHASPQPHSSGSTLGGYWLGTTLNRPAQPVKCKENDKACLEKQQKQLKH